MTPNAGAPLHTKENATKKASPLIVEHRGASGYRPEHTMASYELAARMGADYIEPHVVSTKGHVLVVRHENEISGTTDVADHPKFAARRVTKRIDRVATMGWLTEDFTLAELRTLHAKERLPQVRQANTLYDGRWPVLTLQRYSSFGSGSPRSSTALSASSPRRNTRPTSRASASPWRARS
jgi:glycerophosphoryl diester phosphodiesterase